MKQKKILIVVGHPDKKSTKGKKNVGKSTYWD